MVEGSVAPPELDLPEVPTSLDFHPSANVLAVGLISDIFTDANRHLPTSRRHRFATFVTIRVRRVFVCGCRVALLRFSLSRLWLSNREVALWESKDRIPG